MQILEMMAKTVSSQTDGLIINSYLPRSIELKLCLSLGMPPIIRSTPYLTINEKPDKKLRRK